MPIGSDKPLPLVPPYLTELEAQVLKLQKRIVYLEEVIEVLYKQSLQYSTVLNQRQAVENGLTRGLEKTLKNLIDIASVHRQNQDQARRVEKQTIAEWEGYCAEVTNQRGGIIEHYLEEVKEKMIERESQEVLSML